jgi:hypothetical protein
MWRRRAEDRGALTAVRGLPGYRLRLAAASDALCPDDPQHERE